MFVRNAIMRLIPNETSLTKILVNSSIDEGEKYGIKYFSEEKCSLSPRETRIGRLM